METFCSTESPTRLRREPPYPLCRYATSPPDRGSRPFTRGPGGAHPRVASLGLRPIHLQPLPYKITGALPDLGRGGPWASRQDSDRERWLKKLRRSCGTAPDTIFRSLRAQWPGGNLDTHSDFARRKGTTPDQESAPVMGVRGRLPRAGGDVERSETEGVGWRSYGPRRSEAEP